jgi:hypothetical protein
MVRTKLGCLQWLASVSYHCARDKDSYGCSQGSAWSPSFIWWQMLGSQPQVTGLWLGMGSCVSHTWILA